MGGIKGVSILFIETVRTMTKTILIIGATSSLAKELARDVLDTSPCHFILWARDEQTMDAEAKDLLLHGALSVKTRVFDAENQELIQKEVQALIDLSAVIDYALIAYGQLIPQQQCEESTELLRQQLEVNGVSTVMLLESLASFFTRQKKGTLAVIGSVAGDKGKRSNYAYGSAKAMVEVYTQGLRQRLYSSNVRVLLLKPGMVRTKMTEELEQGFLYSSCSSVAKQLKKALFGKGDVYYLPGFWRWILMVFKLMPEALFKRLKL